MDSPEGGQGGRAAPSFPTSTKSKNVEAGTTDTSLEQPQASLSMPPPSRPLKLPRSSLLHSRRDSSNSEAWSEDIAAIRTPENETGSFQEDTETPRLLPEPDNERTEHRQLPDPVLIPTSRSSLSETDVKRMSVSSMYSMASARGVPSSAASTNGSDAGTSTSVPRSVSGLMASSPGKQGETGLSNVTVTTASQGVGGHLAPREATHQFSPESLKRGQPQPPRSDAANTSRAQPIRDRSRATRRFSGSTTGAVSGSHSPSSDRGGPSHHKEKEEGSSDVPAKKLARALTGLAVKPAPLGVIGVCALDVKARSKPSRNILNRLIANREFDVKVFGDKVILDEDIENWPICDYLISFYSDGFPLDKAIAYVKARKPFCVNDVPMQKILWDRRICLRLLDKIGVPTPPRLEVNRDGGPRLLTPDIAKHIRDITGISFEPTPTEIDQMTLPRNIELLDDGDILSVDGALLKKPFVEKPTSGEDHNIIIYFPKSAGGGGRKLFRKIGNKSSEYVESLDTPRAITQPGESFIYEKFMRVENAEDVKAYTVGPEYCHAETRKSPAVDGVVRRNTHGKEVRYVTSLNAEEKEIASKIATTFGQRVCGFDFLRADNKSYVIDVNGWSFVKDNEEYYDQSAKILRDMFMKERARKGGVTPPMPSPIATDFDPLAKSANGGKEKGKETQLTGMLPNQKSAPKAQNANTVLDANNRDIVPSAETTPPKAESIKASNHGSGTASPAMPQLSEAFVKSQPSSAPTAVPVTPNFPDVGQPEAEAQTPPPPPPQHSWKLKGMVSVIRHADRTPKQKYKFTFHTGPFIELLKGHQEEVLLIGEAALASVREAVDVAMKEGVEDHGKLKSLRNVLLKKGSWPGTKVQIKPMFRKKKTDELVPAEEKVAVKDELSTLPEESPDPTCSGNETPGKDYKPRLPPKRQDSLSDVTMSKFTAAENSLELDKLQLIVKWGGEPTHSARYQAQELGDNMRNDLMLLNREILDKVYVYSSSERRVTTSAQIWAASFLDNKDLPEDYIKVRKDLLDDSNAAKDEMDKVKKKLKGLLRKGNERPPQFAWPENMPEPSEVQTRVVQLMNFHRRVMQYNYNKLYSGAVNSLNAFSNPSSDKLKSGEGSSISLHSASALSQANAVNDIQPRWCCGEDAELFKERWEKLFQEFCDGDKVDPSKISELYDTMKFDALHNRQFLEWVFKPTQEMLEEEEGFIAASAKEGKPAAAQKDSEGQAQTGKSSEDSKNGDKTSVQEGDKDGHDARKRRLWRKRSWKHGMSHVAPSEEYFNLYKGDSQTKAKTDARFAPLRELYQLAKILFDFICPQEYGISDSEKLEIGLLTSLPLLKEIVTVLEEMQASDDAESFFYFTKESHIYTLLNCILEGGIETKITRSTIPELDYLSQICFELYESESHKPKPAEGESESETFPTFTYSIRITISPGCHVYDPLDVQLDSRHCISCAPRRSLTPHIDWKKVIETLRAKFHQVKLPKTFVAVNLSDAFSWEERHNSDAEFLEMQTVERAAMGPDDAAATAGLGAEAGSVAAEAGEAGAVQGGAVQE